MIPLGIVSMVTLRDLNRDSNNDVAKARPEFVPLSESGCIIETLSVASRRAILSEICSEPANAAAVAERVGTSVQNALYHLAELEEAGLVTVVGTHYSEKGLQMRVYGPTSTVIVIDVEEDDSARSEGAFEESEAQQYSISMASPAE